MEIGILHVKRATIADLKKKLGDGKAVGGGFLCVCSPYLALESLLEMLLALYLYFFSLLRISLLTLSSDSQSLLQQVDQSPIVFLISLLVLKDVIYLLLANPYEDMTLSVIYRI